MRSLKISALSIFLIILIIVTIFILEKLLILHPLIKAKNNIIAEEYIVGREITVPVLGNLVYPIIEIKPAHDFYDYDCKYTPGLTEYHCPAELEGDISSSIKEDTALLFNEFGCSVYGRIDYLIDKNGYHYFLEVNTLPGMTQTSLLPKSLASIGINFDSLIKKIIELSI